MSTLTLAWKPSVLGHCTLCLCSLLSILQIRQAVQKTSVN